MEWKQGDSFNGKRRYGTVYFMNKEFSCILSLSEKKEVEKWFMNNEGRKVEFQKHDLVEFVLTGNFVVVSQRIGSNTMERPFSGVVVKTNASHIWISVSCEDTLCVPKENKEEFYCGDIITFAYDNTKYSKFSVFKRTSLVHKTVGECPICLEEKNLISVSNCEDRDHLMCSDCTKDWLLSIYKDLSKYPLTCSKQDCSKLVRFNKVAKFLSPDQLQTMETFYCYSCIPEKNRSKCPNCDFLMFYSFGKTVGKCIKCKLVYCGKCSNSWQAHKGKSCQQLSEEQSFKNLAEKSGWKQCPKCKTQIEKITGCNHITHKNCSNASDKVKKETHFCYCCGTLLIDSKHTPDGINHFPNGTFLECQNKMNHQQK